MLRHSEVVKEQPWLYQLLEQHEQLTDEFILTLPKSQQDFLSYMKDRLIKQASLEWVCEGEEDDPSSDLGDDRIPCSLCGTGTRYMFHIVNRLNGNKLNVGSTCITHFDELTPDGKSGKQLAQEHLKFRKQAALNKAVPGIFQTVDAWNDRIDNYPIVVSKRLTDRYMAMGIKFRSYVDAFMKSNKEGRASAVEKIRNLMPQYHALIAEIRDYVRREESKESPFVARRRIARWLVRNNETQGLEWLQEDGEIRWRTARRIREPNFMKSLIPFLNNVLRPIGVIVDRPDESGMGYMIHVGKWRDIRLFIRHQELVEEYGGFLTNENTGELPVLQVLISYSEIAKENHSIIAAMQEVNRYLGRSMELIEHDLEFNSLYAQVPGTRYIYEVPLHPFLQRYKGIVFHLEQPPKEQIIAELKRGNQYTKDEFERLKDDREDAYATQGEMI